MKDSLRDELQQELKEQLTLLGKSLVEELKGHLGQASTTEALFQPPGRPHSDRDPRRQRLGSAPLTNSATSGMLKAVPSVVSVG